MRKTTDQGLDTRKLYIFWHDFIIIYLFIFERFIRERKRESMQKHQKGQREREREKERSRLC